MGTTEQRLREVLAGDGSEMARMIRQAMERKFKLKKSVDKETYTAVRWAHGCNFAT